jgi:tetrahydromethanopterin S-methyltransferase subunit C
MFGAAGVTGLLSLGALTACLVLALNHAVADWLAALIVALVWGAVAGVLALRGRDKVQEAAPPVPEQTVETVKEDVQWAKTQTRSGSR